MHTQRRSTPDKHQYTKALGQELAWNVWKQCDWKSEELKVLEKHRDRLHEVAALFIRLRESQAGS